MAPNLMKAAVIHEFGPIDTIHIEEIAIAEPADQEVQIQVHSAGVNPVDWKICEGQLKSRTKYEFPIILGWDVSGVISKIGRNVKNFKIGDAVFAYCRKDTIHAGTFAEYTCVDSQNVASKPSNLSHSQAASIPLAALTAWQSLFDTAHLEANEQVLIHAGAGGVGTLAIQLAKHKGAKVITTASARNKEYVEKLGADTIIDYTKEDFAQKIMALMPEGVDVVFDTVGTSTLESSYAIVKQGGRLVSIAGLVDQSLAEKRNIQANYVFVRPDGKELSHVAHLIEKGVVVAPNIEEVPFVDVVKALKKNAERHVQGKLVLKMRS